MNLTLYRYDAEPNRIDKTPYFTGSSRTFSFDYIYEQYDPNETDLKLKTGATMSSENVDDYNYASDGTRYYYLTHRYDPQGNLIFHIKCDPLMTFKDAIGKLNVQAIRSNKGDPNLSNDNFMPMKNRFVEDIKATTGPVGSDWYILTVAGSIGNAPTPTI